VIPAAVGPVQSRTHCLYCIAKTAAWLRWLGIAGIAGSVGYLIGDVLLIGNSANPAEFPHLATYVDNRLVQRGAVFLASSTERLAAGGLAGVFSTPLCLAGMWHIFEASKPGGTRWSLPPFMLLVTAFSIAVRSWVILLRGGSPENGRASGPTGAAGARRAGDACHILAVHRLRRVYCSLPTFAPVARTFLCF
jgi:hypothetical protein